MTDEAGEPTDETPPTTGARVVVDALTKTYPLGGGETLRAIDDVGLTIEAGSTVAIAGPSGSGKSTLLHLVGAIERPSSGQVAVDGQDLAALRRRQLAAYRRRVGFVFQRYHLLPTLTAANNVLAPVLPYRTTFDKAARAAELLAAVGLEDRGGALPSRLSGGEQQRVAIARALVNQPRLVLADEPTGNLDSVTGSEIMDLLLDVRDQHGMTILVATHDPQVAARCDRLVRLRDGRVVDDLVVSGSGSMDRTLDRISRLAP
ncbi:MAG: ABC transporter ATP-binding protein [Acidimicrobiales bacterium]